MWQRHLTSIFLYIFIFSFSKVCAEPLELNLDAQAAILVNADTGRILYEKDADKLLYPASTTKIATALYALKVKGLELEENVIAQQDSIGSVSWSEKVKSHFTLPAHWIEHGSSHIGIKRGERLSFKTLLYALMVASGNDAANVIGQFVSGDVPTFMNEVNAYLNEIGCKNTHYKNPHGLHHPKHQTTARDLVLMTREALKDPVFRNLVLTKRYTRPKTNMQEPMVMVQTNRLIKKGSTYYYPKAIGVKTGYTGEAGYNLVAAAKDQGRTLIAVVLKCKDRGDTFENVKKMFEKAFNQTKMRRRLLKEGMQNLSLNLEGAAQPLKTYIQDEVGVDYFPAEEPTIEAHVQWQDLTLPISKGQRVGEIKLYSNDNSFVKFVPLLALEEVKPTFWFSMKRLWNGNSQFFLGSIFFLGSSAFSYIVYRKKK
ncbi:MAG: D-alanyl-D-alanine carboxypeptidase (penicillin-binding protein 5/6) [Chlamydiales bacterium]|jgi:D-alanyl-D-alanine carboxypeptidase (penicillin-binding protein 5/6)